MQRPKKYCKELLISNAEAEQKLAAGFKVPSQMPNEAEAEQ
jgi:hypothetical protein